MTKKEGTRKTRGKRKKLESTICLYLTIIADLWSTDCAYFVLSILCIYLLLESQSHTKREGLLLSSFYGWDHWGSENLSHLPEVTQLVQKAKRESKPLQYTRREENGPGQWEKKKRQEKMLRGKLTSNKAVPGPTVPPPECASLTGTNLGTLQVWEWDLGIWRKVHSVFMATPAQMLPRHLRGHLILGWMVAPKDMSTS